MNFFQFINFRNQVNAREKNALQLFEAQNILSELVFEIEGRSKGDNNENIND